MSRSTIQSLLSLKAIIASIGLAALGVALLLVQEQVVWVHERPWLSTPLRELGSLLVASIALAALWDLYLKRQFQRELTESFAMAESLERGGIVDVASHFYHDIDWPGFFEHVRELDIVLSYGATWRRMHEDKIRDLLSRQNVVIRILLPDPEDADLMRDLARRYNLDAAEVAERVSNAISDYLSYIPMSKKKGRLKIYLAKKNFTWSSYRFDNVALLSFYSHGLVKGQSPTLLIRRGGTMFGYVSSELEPYFAAKIGYARLVVP